MQLLVVAALPDPTWHWNRRRAHHHLGATGGTERELVSQALQKGHDVSAFARTPGKLSVVDSRLRVVQGDIQRAETIRTAMKIVARGVLGLVCIDATLFGLAGRTDWLRHGS